MTNMTKHDHKPNTGLVEAGEKGVQNNQETAGNMDNRLERKGRKEI